MTLKKFVRSHIGRGRDFDPKVCLYSTDDVVHSSTDIGLFRRDVQERSALIVDIISNQSRQLRQESIDRNLPLILDLITPASHVRSCLLIQGKQRALRRERNGRLKVFPTNWTNNVLSVFSTFYCFAYRRTESFLVFFLFALVFLRHLSFDSTCISSLSLSLLVERERERKNFLSYLQTKVVRLIFVLRYVFAVFLSRGFLFVEY